ncbi:hypothetical protein L6654_00685 [Bradyrhizobium sp. WYCCWR 13023]|uniref:Uncharacterized protein n=1 Tax=Bradyrhizobium zhengyangense TaxID=2911009 RepID=A0A9X1R463_9BRAD|nr:hypothetical protein [Bradyrhizobium sp. CCBAU 11434]MCG2625121.1 hypothetical protein [Bradyrhizobium zhengyangense]MCG2641564.1 hypothetical protein [Bradyrhizobium zhengyangense]MDA9523777.1 hypothetical protein [Bradyrhizobium sp. CCBAU 11434]
MEEDPDTYRILRLRAEILELGSAIRQLQREGLDDATAQLLITRKRAQLDHLMKASSTVHPLNIPDIRRS